MSENETDSGASAIVVMEMFAHTVAEVGVPDLTIGDFNNDGRCDIFVANAAVPNQLPQA